MTSFLDNALFYQIATPQLLLEQNRHLCTTVDNQGIGLTAKKCATSEKSNYNDIRHFLREIFYEKVTELKHIFPKKNITDLAKRTSIIIMVLSYERRNDILKILESTANDEQKNYSKAIK